jgi:hypothetical protein
MKQSVKSLALSIFICLFSAIIAAAQQQQQISPAISLVPDKSVAVLRVNWMKVRGDEKLKRIVNGESFPKIANQIGVSEAKVGEWVIFSDVNATSSRGLGIIVSGNFTAQSIAAFAKSKDWKAEKIGAAGATAYINPSDNSYLLPLRNGLVAAGTKSGMEKVQSVLSKQTAGLIAKAPFNSMWTELNSGGGRQQQPISFMIGVPQQYQKVAEIAYKVAAKLMNLTSFGFMGTVMEKVGLMRCLGFNVSHKEGVYPTRLFAMMDSETKAWVASGALNLLKKAPSAIGNQPRTEEDRRAMQALETLSASYRGEILSVKFDMPERALPQ